MSLRCKLGRHKYVFKLYESKKDANIAVFAKECKRCKILLLLGYTDDFFGREGIRDENGFVIWENCEVKGDLSR